jgi:hypothetical protein
MRSGRSALEVSVAEPPPCFGKVVEQTLAYRSCPFALCDPANHVPQARRSLAFDR